MSFNPNSIQKGAKREPRKIILYGPPKLGKSTMAGSTRNALMIPTEDRVAHINCDKTEIVKSYDEILSVFDYLLNGQHVYKRVIIDTLDEFEPLLHQAICEKNNWKSLVEDKNKETNFNKGLQVHAVAGWRKFLHNCDTLRIDAGIDAIFVAHAQTIKVNPPDHDAYDKWAMKVDKHAIPILEAWADIVGFYDRAIWVDKKDEKSKTGKVINKGTRVLHLAGDSAAMVACNSYGFADIEGIKEEDCPDFMEWLLTGPYGNNNEEKTNVKINKKGEK